MKIKSESDLKKIGVKTRKGLVSSEVRIQVGTSTCGLAKGAHLLKKALEAEVKEQGLNAQIVDVGCNGMCHQEPIVDVIQKGKPKITYGAMTPDQAAPLVKALKSGGLLEEQVLFRTDQEDNLISGDSLNYTSGQPAESLKKIAEYQTYPFYQKQQKITLRNAGRIDPASLEEYIACGGYSGLAKALSMPPEKVLQEVIASGIPSAASMCYDSIQNQLVIPLNPNDALAFIPLD